MHVSKHSPTLWWGRTLTKWRPKARSNKPSGRCDWNDVSADGRSHGPRTPTLFGQLAKERVIVTSGISHGFAPIKDEASIVGSYQILWLAVVSPTQTRARWRFDDESIRSHIVGAHWAVSVGVLSISRWCRQCSDGSRPLRSVPLDHAADPAHFRGLAYPLSVSLKGRLTGRRSH